MLFTISTDVQERFRKALVSAIAIPFIDDIEDYIVESIWAYTKGVPNEDPFYSIRSKRLFDVTDNSNGIGWSVKSLQWAFSPGCEFELVIQRAAIYKKAEQLGFSGLSQNSEPDVLGEALLRHWRIKVEEDAVAQGVIDKRIMVLLKTEDKKRYSIFEDAMHLYDPNELRWEWTSPAKNGLKGVRICDGMCVYRWYPSQTQFFERFKLPPTAYQFTIEPQRLEIDSVAEMLVEYLR
jgi:hypothetical protein